ncbi:MAG: histidine phosphatase family protein [Gammaproteobacteria bacterium]
MAIKRTLLILRHAKSDWSAGASDDFKRPLSKRGRKDSPRMGKWMLTRGLVPEIIISSPAKRARQTLELVCSELCPGRDNIIWDERIYMADLQALLEVLRESPDQARSILLVGHNPGLEDLLLHLAGNLVPEPADGKTLPTATLAEIEFDCHWHELQADSARLVKITRPRNLPE